MAGNYLDNDKFEILIINFQSTKRELSRTDMLIEAESEALERKKNRGLKYEKEKELIEKFKDRISVVGKEHEIYKSELVDRLYELSCNAIRNRSVHLPRSLWDDAIQGSVIVCLEKVDRFNPFFVGKYGKKSKAFNYISTCIINHFRGLGRNEKRENEFMTRYYEDMREI